MGNAPYKNLIVWQKSDLLVKEIYSITKSFPREEQFGITSQIRRSALSVVLNIVEGYSRQGLKERKNFINMSLGSLAETEYLIELTRELGYLNKEDFDKIISLRQEVGNLLWKYYLSL